MNKTGIMLFIDSIGESFEIRHIIKVQRRKGGKRFYETNDGKWYAESEFNLLSGKGKVLKAYVTKVGDFIATRDFDGTYFIIQKEVFDKVLKIDGHEPYDYNKYTMPVKPLPKGL